MSEEDARGLAEFIKDHDKRFEAKAKTDDMQSVVLLTRAADGTTLEPITETAQYLTLYIQQEDPGPTVRAAWEKWHSRNASQ